MVRPFIKTYKENDLSVEKRQNNKSNQIINII